MLFITGEAYYSLARLDEYDTPHFVDADLQHKLRYETRRSAIIDAHREENNLFLVISELY